MDAMANKAMAEIISPEEICKEKVMRHRVTNECLPIFNIDGSLRKGQKSKLIEKFKLVELQQFEKCMRSLTWDSSGGACNTFY